MVPIGEDADLTKHSPERRLQLEDFLPYRISVLAESVREPLLRHYLARFDIGVPEWRITVVLAHHRVLTAKEIGRIGRMHKTKVSRALAFLESRGFVAREANHSDLRESFVSLTEDGTKLYGRLIDAARDYSARLATALSDGERAVFEEMLRRLQARADTLAHEWHEIYRP